MRVKDRIKPFPIGSIERRAEFQRIKAATGAPRKQIEAMITAQNDVAIHTPMRNEECGAWARTRNRYCRRPALANGRCRNHGGMVPNMTDEQKAECSRKYWERQARIRAQESQSNQQSASDQVDKGGPAGDSPPPTPPADSDEV